MKKRLLIVVFLLVFAMIMPVHAASDDMVDGYAAEYLQAVEAGKSAFTATVPTGDFAALLQQVFERYPVLFYYYNGYSGTIGVASSKITMQLQSVDTPWRSVYLVDSEKTLKAVVGLGLAQLRQQMSFVTVGGYSISNGTIAKLTDEIMAESYLAYMGYAGNSYSYSAWDAPKMQRCELSLKYWSGVSLTELATWRKETEQVAIHLASTLFAQDMPDYQKELLIHDWLVENNRYNTEDMSAPASHMAYSALVTGKPVCQGYGEAMLLLSQAAGLPCLYVTGSGTSNGNTESHGWNCIKLDGQWYMVDVTWDDPTTSDGSDVLQYDYFNVTSRQLAKDHNWDQSAFPECTATALNADRVRQLCENSTAVYTQYSPDRLVTLAEAEAQFLRELQKTAPQDPAETPGTSPVVPPAQEKPNNGSSAAQPKQENHIGVWIIVAVVVLVAAGGLGSYVYTQKQEEARRRRRQKYFDPTEPFDGYGY